MQPLLFRLNTLFEHLPGALLPYRWLCLLAFLAMSLFTGSGLVQHFQLNMSPEVWFEDNAPPLEIRDAFRRQFGSDEGIYIVYRPASNDVFSEDALRTLESLHKEIEQASLQDQAGGMSRVTQVDSLFNARYQIADGDTLIAKKLIGADFPESAAERERRREIALSQDAFARVYYSEDFQYGGIAIKTNFGTLPAESELNTRAENTDDLLADDGFGFGLEASDPLSVDTSAEVAEVEFASVQLEEYTNFMTALRAITEQPQYDDFESILSATR